MKKQTLRTTVVLAAIPLFFAAVSCNFGNLTMPKKAEVSTQAAYRIQFGDLAPLLEDGLKDFSPQDMLDEVKAGLGEKADLWDYDDGSGTLSYVIHTNFNDKMPNLDPEASMPDIDSMLSGRQGDGLGFDPISLSIPQFSFGDFSINPITIPDFAGTVTSSMSLPELNEIPTTETNGSIAGQDAEVRTDSEKGITYGALHVKSGGINLKLARTDTNSLGESYTLSVTIELKDVGTGSVIATATNGLLRDGGTLSLDLGGKALPQNFDVSISGSMTGSYDYETIIAEAAVGNYSHTHKYSCEIAFSDDFKLDKVTGLTANADALGIGSMPSINPDPISMETMIGLFESATLGDNSAITVQAENPKLTSDANKYFFESGLSITPEISISGVGLSASFVDDGDTSGYLIKKKCDLGNQDISVTDGDSVITVSGSIEFSLSDATINFDNGSSATSIPINFDASVDSLKSAVINLKSDKYKDMPVEFNLADTLGDDKKNLPKEMITFVKTISFGEGSKSDGFYKHDSDGILQSSEEYKSEGLGISCNLVNSLPIGNNIPISIKSEIFGLDLSVNFEGQGSETPASVSWVDWPQLDFTGYSKDKPAAIDLTLTMGTEDGDKRTVTLADIKFGETYTLGISDVGFKFDWDKVEADFSSIELKPDPDKPIDMSMLDISSSLQETDAISADDIKKIEISEIPVFFYLQNPGDGTTSKLAGLLNGIGLKGTMNVGDVYFLGSKSEEDGTVNDGVVSFMGSSVPWGSVAGGVVEENSPIIPYITKYTDAEVSSWTKDERKYSFSADLSEIVNKVPSGELSSGEGSDLVLDYNLSVTGSNGGTITVYHDMLKSSGESGTEETQNTGLSMDMAARLTLQLTLKEDIEMNLSEFMSSSSDSDESESAAEPKDLLGRTEDNDPLKDFVSVAEAIEYAKIAVKVNNFLLKGVNFGLSVDDSHDGDTRYSGLVMGDTLNLSIDSETGNGEISMTLSTDDFITVLDSTYFYPDIKLSLKAGDLRISRNLLDGFGTTEATENSADKFSARVMFEVKGSGKPTEIDFSSFGSNGGGN